MSGRSNPKRHATRAFLAAMGVRPGEPGTTRVKAIRARRREEGTSWGHAQLDSVHFKIDESHACGLRWRKRARLIPAFAVRGFARGGRRASVPSHRQASDFQNRSISGTEGFCTKLGSSRSFLIPEPRSAAGPAALETFVLRPRRKISQNPLRTYLASSFPVEPSSRAPRTRDARTNRAVCPRTSVAPGCASHKRPARISHAGGRKSNDTALLEPCASHSNSV